MSPAFNPFPMLHWVVIPELPDQRLPQVGKELIADACSLSRQQKAAVGCYVFSPGPLSPQTKKELADSGCARIDVFQSRQFSHCNPDDYLNVLGQYWQEKISCLFIPQTPFGEELAAGLCLKKNIPWIHDTLTVRATRDGGLSVSSVLPGNQATKVRQFSPDEAIVVTMKEGIADCLPSSVGTTGAHIIETEIPKHISFPGSGVSGYLTADPSKIDITEAEKIVSAGYGTGGPGGVALVQKLADSLSASLAASRMVVDAGWLKQERQVGMTGKTVCPRLYVACGISGASHHLMGMRDSTHIVAINPDETAPIHEIAHLSIRSDLHLLIPEVISKLEKRRHPEAHHN